MEYKRFRIPNRDVKLTKMETSVTCTRTFQRLFYLKQLGLVHLVYPCATHSRAGHSIECLDEANKLLESIGVTKGSDWEDVRMAALLHDIGHVPFSHTLEDEHQVLPKHDKRERIELVLGKLQREVESEVRPLIERAKPILLAIAAEDERDHDWRSDLVGNTVCADLLAYITTDAAWTGIEKRPGYYRIYEYFQKANKTVGGRVNPRFCIRLTKGGLRTDIVSAILDLMDMRYALTERVIFHHAKAMASAMLARAARLAGLRDDKPPPKDEKPLSEMGDEVFLDYLEVKGRKHPDEVTGKGIEVLLNHLRSRNLYKRFFKVQRQAMEDWNRSNGRGEEDTFCSQWRDSEKVENLLTKIEDRFDLPRGSLVLWCPEGKSGMKLVKANVIWEQSEGWHDPVELRSEEVKRQFPGVHARVSTIESQYFDLWTFWVGIQPEQITKAPAVIGALEDELKIKCDPVFIESYAKTHLPGFEEASRLHGRIEGTWKEQILPGVSQRVMDAAARPGTEVDSSVINEAIHTVSSEKSASTKRKPQRKDAKLPDLLKDE